MIRHASNPLYSPEFTLCGVAFDVGDVEPGEESPTFAMPGQIINCPQCRAVIIWAKAIRNFHEPPADVTIATREAFEEG
jgi:hypothetical protein